MKKRLSRAPGYDSVDYVHPNDVGYGAMPMRPTESVALLVVHFFPLTFGHG